MGSKRSCGHKNGDEHNGRKADPNRSSQPSKL
jgi:hypothetical protein